MNKEDLNAAYSDEDLDYLDDKLIEWAMSNNRDDFTTWMLAGNDPLGVLKHLKEDD